MALTGLGVTSLTLGALAWRVGGVWWDQDAAPEHAILSAHELVIVSSICEALFPGEQLGVDPIPGALEVGVPQFLDRFLAQTLDELTANAIRLLIHAIDELAIPSDAGLARFHKRSLEERIEILRAWDESGLTARRGAFSALKLFLAMGYCEDPRVIESIGITYSCGGLA